MKARVALFGMAGIGLVAAALVLWWGRGKEPAAEPRPVDQADRVNPRPGQPGHRPHEEWEGAYPTLTSQKEFEVLGAFSPPDGFLGNLTYDPASGRMWLVSLGPPTNRKGPSTLYEVDPSSGKVLRQAAMPFRGDFGQPVYIDGFLYQGIFHESKMYKVDVRADGQFGQIVKTISLPTVNDLKLVNEAHAYPFIEFGGVAVTPDKNIIFHADDVGEFITVERETGRILARVRTLKALGGITGVPGPTGQFLVLGNSDPRGGYCALAYPPELSRSAEQKDVSWALLDPATGEVLSSLRKQNSPAYASTVCFKHYEKVKGTGYGRYHFFATGEEGILTLAWTPERNGY
jgi:hypothetical protein